MTQPPLAAALDTLILAQSKAAAMLDLLGSESGLESFGEMSQSRQLSFILTIEDQLAIARNAADTLLDLVCRQAAEVRS